MSHVRKHIDPLLSIMMNTQFNAAVVFLKMWTNKFIIEEITTDLSTGCISLYDYNIKISDFYPVLLISDTTMRLYTSMYIYIYHYILE